MTVDTRVSHNHLHLGVTHRESHSRDTQRFLGMNAGSKNIAKTRREIGVIKLIRHDNGT